MIKRSGAKPQPAPIALDVSMLPQLAQWLALHPRSPSEYNLSNLFLYRARHGYALCEDEGGMAITGTTYDGERHVLPLGRLTPERALSLLDRADCIYPLDEEEAVALCADTPFVMAFNPADSDYLYEADALARLAGAKKKRAQARAFEQMAFPTVRVLGSDTIACAHDVLDGWLMDVARAPGATDLAECREALALMDVLNLSGLVILAGEAPVGLLIAGDGHDGERVVHFAKGRRAHAGVYPWMFAHFALAAGGGRINFEQDLGNAGLAQSKRAFAPVAQRHKFRVRIA